VGLVDLQAAWYGQGTLLGRVLSAGLSPLALAYRAGQAAHAGAQRPVRVDRPVISVGNLTVGGSGKTPLVIALVGLLEARGLKVAVLSRGYRRESKGSRVVSVPGGSALDVRAAGDEPYLIALRCPNAAVVVGEDRLDAARLVIETWAPDVLVCDDAFGHLRLARDLDVVAIHARRGFGNRRLLPAGPLREPLAALRRASLAVFTHCRARSTAELRSGHALPDSLPAASCRFEPVGLVAGQGLEPTSQPPPRRIVAACAIADPQGFFEDLRRQGFELVARTALRDHQRIGRRELAHLARQVALHGADALVVTEKDLVKIEDPPEGLSLLAPRLEVRWADQDGRTLVLAALAGVVAGERKED